MYRAGTEETFVIVGSAESFWTSLDFWNGVSSPRLASEVEGRLLGRIDVFTDTIADRGFSDLGTWQYRAVMQAASRSDHASVNDVAAIIRNAFYEATGYLPTVSVISAGQAEPPQLAPGILPDVGAGIGDAARNLGEGFNATLQKLIDNLGMIGAVGIGVAVVVVGVIVWSKAD
jgi:hypothetical protein